MVTVMTAEGSRAALVAVRGRSSARPLRRLSPPACRCRPGDVAEWVRLELSSAQAEALREVAAAASVALDVWLAVMVEFSISLRALRGPFGSVDAARAELAKRAEVWPIEVAWLPEWRAWQSSFSRRLGTGGDELPEVVLPQRLRVRAGGAIDVAAALDCGGDWALARVCELAACGAGQTLEAFVLQAGLVDACRGARLTRATQSARRIEDALFEHDG